MQIILDNNYLINNNIISESFVQLNKEIIELKTKIDSYRNELLLSNQNFIKNSINSKYNNEQNVIKNNNILNYNNEINKDNIMNEINNISNSNISLNKNNELNIPPGLEINNLYNNNINYQNELNIPSLEINKKYDNDTMNNINNNIINNKNENINPNDRFKKIELISEINGTNNNNINLNSNNNDFDYSEVLPIIDKVSKLKEFNELEEEYDNQKTHNLISQRTKLTTINLNPNSNEDDDAPNIVNNILDALSNKLIESQLNNKKEKEIIKDEDNEINKPKLISKNKNSDVKPTKIISFQEFLEKEEKNNDI